jgi:cytochrome b involved in lipid metabolism
MIVLVLLMMATMILIYCLSYDQNKIVAIKNSNLSMPPTKTVVVFNNEKYDLTDFLKIHPGGSDIIEKYNHKDITDIMRKAKHSQNAYTKLAKYKIDYFAV